MSATLVNSNIRNRRREFNTDEYPEHLPERITKHHHDEVTMMKVFFFGMILSAAFGPAIIAQTVPMQLWPAENTVALIGGTAGLAICLLLYSEPSDGEEKKKVRWKSGIRQMGRDSLANLITAVVGGPPAAYWVGHVMSIEMCSQLIIPVSAVLGFGGASLLRIALPIWQTAWQKWNSRKAAELSGEKTE